MYRILLILLFVLAFTPSYLFAGVKDASLEGKVPASIEGMVLVKGGCFEMGDIFDDGHENERPVHEVCLDDFYIAKYEVTIDDWKKVMRRLPKWTVSFYNFKDYKKCGECALGDVRWEGAQEYIEKLNKKTGMSYRLPTEAEWEYAARSGGKRERWAGTNDKDELVNYAWYENHSEGRNMPVGLKRPNGLGLYDMSGNVSEWTADYYDACFYESSPRDNPTVAEKPADDVGYYYIVYRGGSWFNSAYFLNVTKRRYRPFGHSFVDRGFRLAHPAK